MAKLKLSEKDKQKISLAVKQAESNTSGEIATAFIRQSYDYAIYELLFAVIISFVYFLLMLFFLPQIQAWLQTMFWDYKISHLVVFYGFSTFMVGTIFYFLANIAFLDRLIVPNKILHKKVYERALLHFMESGISYTRDRTGILIFISLLEHRVVLLADSGINEKIEQSSWQNIVNQVTAGVKQGNFSDHLVQAIKDCGALLAEHFPIKDDNTNELPNAIEELEK